MDMKNQDKKQGHSLPVLQEKVLRVRASSLSVDASVTKQMKGA